MLSQQSLLRLEGNVLRAYFQSELRTGSCFGEEYKKEYIQMSADKLGHIVNVTAIIDELADLLQKYEDFTLEQMEGLLYVKGYVKQGRKRKVELCRGLRLQYENYADTIVLAVTANGVPFYCNQLQFLDNLNSYFGMQLAILIQDDEKLKAFFEEYIEWLKPYREQAKQIREAFCSELADTVYRIASAFPAEKTAVIPTAFNVPFLLFHLEKILIPYRLPGMMAESFMKILGFRLSFRAGQDFSCYIDPKTFNAILLTCTADAEAEYYSAVLNERQIVLLMKQLIVTGMQSENPISRLFARELADVVYEMMCYREEQDEMSIVSGLERYLELWYC